jgi:sulfate permease, SulP family
MTGVAATKPLRHGLSGDVSGAFADGAVLFPLLLALAWQTGASAAVMLATTGAAYLATGWLFRLPIPVQPLKSLSVMAIAAGASAQELQMAGLLLGVIYFSISFCPVNRLANRIPLVLVHGFQLGLGIMLIVAALRMLGAAPAELAMVVAAAAVLIVITRLTRLPILGIIAAGGLVWGMMHAVPAVSPDLEQGIRATIVALMVLPQIALTLTNSVLGTQRAAQDYYGERADRVTPRRLLQSLGLGNLIVGSLGGMPYCHGSGGVTAHYRGGSRTWRSNVIIGLTLLVMSGLLVLGGGGLPEYPAMLQALLIGVIGWFHFQLARPSWQAWPSRLVLMLMGMTALAFTNMLAVLVAGTLAVVVAWWLGHRFPVPQAITCDTQPVNNIKQVPTP